MYISLFTSFATLCYLYQDYNTLDTITDIQWIKQEFAFSYYYLLNNDS